MTPSGTITLTCELTESGPKVLLQTVGSKATPSSMGYAVGAMIATMIECAEDQEEVLRRAGMLAEADAYRAACSEGIHRPPSDQHVSLLRIQQVPKTGGAQ